MKNQIQAYFSPMWRDLFDVPFPSRLRFLFSYQLSPSLFFYQPGNEFDNLFYLWPPKNSTRANAFQVKDLFTFINYFAFLDVNIQLFAKMESDDETNTNTIIEKFTDELFRVYNQTSADDRDLFLFNIKEVTNLAQSKIFNTQRKLVFRSVESSTLQSMAFMSTDLATFHRLLRDHFSKKNRGLLRRESGLFDDNEALMMHQFTHVNWARRAFVSVLFHSCIPFPIIAPYVRLFTLI